MYDYRKQPINAVSLTIAPARAFNFILYITKAILRAGAIMAEFKYEIVENVALLSESSKGWKKELNRVSWNGREPKYDIREWSPDGMKMGKGITLNREELKALRDVLNGMDL
jgi:hypothetical protein